MKNWIIWLILILVSLLLLGAGIYVIKRIEFLSNDDIQEIMFI